MRVFAVLLVLGSAVPVAAQTVEENNRAMAHLQAQIDKAQAGAAAHSGLYGSTDWVGLSGTTLLVAGWGYNCADHSIDTIELDVDGVVRPEARVPHGLDRFARPDVAPCPSAVGQRPGVILVLDISSYVPLLPHTVALRMRNQAGVSQRFNGIFIFVCGENPDLSPKVCIQPEGSPRRED